jgi:hypothetical protein
MSRSTAAFAHARERASTVLSIELAGGTGAFGSAELQAIANSVARMPTKTDTLILFSSLNETTATAQR